MILDIMILTDPFLQPTLLASGSATPHLPSSALASHPVLLMSPTLTTFLVKTIAKLAVEETAFTQASLAQAAPLDHHRMQLAWMNASRYDIKSYKN